jgi:hypothetical protein
MAFAHDRLGQHGGGGGAVAGDVGGLGGDFLDELGAHVLVGVVQFDFLGDGHAVLGHDGRAEGLGEHDVAALGSEGHLHRVGEFVDAALEGFASILVERELLCGHDDFPLFDLFVRF